MEALVNQAGESLLLYGVGDEGQAGKGDDQGVCVRYSAIDSKGQLEPHVAPVLPPERISWTLFETHEQSKAVCEPAASLERTRTAELDKGVEQLDSCSPST